MPVVALNPETQIREFFSVLYANWGRQHWWPAESPFEVVVGAILTQNTAWTNVEMAIANLRAAGMLSPTGLSHLSIADLERLNGRIGMASAGGRDLRALHDSLVHLPVLLGRMTGVETALLKALTVTIDLAGDFDEYWSSRPRKLRQMLIRAHMEPFDSRPNGASRLAA